MACRYENGNECESQYHVQERNQNPHKSGFLFHEKEFLFPFLFLICNPDVVMNGKWNGFPISISYSGIPSTTRKMMVELNFLLLLISKNFGFSWLEEWTKAGNDRTKGHLRNSLTGMHKMISNFASCHSSEFTRV